LGKIALGVPPKGATTCSVFLSCYQRGLSATYPAPILAIFDRGEDETAKFLLRGTSRRGNCIEDYITDKHTENRMTTINLSQLVKQL